MTSERDGRGCKPGEDDDGARATFHAEFHELPDGTVTAVIRAPWPSTDDAVEILRRSKRREPKRVAPSVGRARRMKPRHPV